MTVAQQDPPVISKWDPELTKHVVDVMRPIVKRYFRSELRGLENIAAPGGCLVVANHSGGMLTPDWSVFAVHYYDTFGYDRPLYALAHDLVFARRAACCIRWESFAPPATTRPKHWRPTPRSWCSPAVTTRCTGRRSTRV